jgi:hypothetical protein
MTGQHRPLEPVGHDALATFGRRAEWLADELMGLAALPEAARMRPDAYSWEEMRHIADTLRGMALRCALEADDRELLTEVSGRAWPRPRLPATPSAPQPAPRPEPETAPAD